MSAAAAWSYTAKATLWPLLAVAAWGGVPTFAAPIVIDCDYSADARTMRSAEGEEFTSTLTIFTEHATAKRGDRVMLGISTEADPIAAGAREVRALKRDADTFDRLVDDFTLGTI